MTTGNSNTIAMNTEGVRHVTLVGLLANIVLAAIKFVAGWIGNSQAVIADAVHSLSDMGSDIAILVGARYWSEPADRRHPHGHRKIETLVTASIGLSLVFVGIFLAWRAVDSFRDSNPLTPEWIACGAAVISILVKEILYRWTVAAGTSFRSAVLVANAWHHRSDALSSIPAALAVAGGHFGIRFLDPVGAIIISILILQAAWRIARPAIDKLLDSSAPEKTVGEITRIAGETDGVTDVHAVRTRYIGCSSIGVDLHIWVDGDIPVRKGHSISEDVGRRIMDNIPDIVDVVVHLEPMEESG